MIHIRAMSSLLCVSLAFAVGCGGSTPPADAPAATTAAEQHGEGHEKEHGGGGHHGGKGHDDHGNLPAPVKEFHSALAPLWHADKGPERVTKTCEQAPGLKTKADATGDAELVSTTTALVAECAKDGKPDFDAKFKAVHEAFHAVAKKAKHD